MDLAIDGCGIAELANITVLGDVNLNGMANTVIRASQIREDLSNIKVLGDLNINGMNNKIMYIVKVGGQFNINGRNNKVI